MTNQALLQMVYNEPSYCFGVGTVRLCVTRRGGMMAPVTFFSDSSSPIQPYYIAPWWDEGCDPETPSLLATLRGDFFCAPFGDNSEPFEGIDDPPHGETANGDWALENLIVNSGGAALHLSQSQAGRVGKIHKQLAVVQGQSVVYSRHDLIGMEGPICLGHHPTLFIPPGIEAARLSFSPHRHAHTYVKPTGLPEERSNSILKPDAEIEDLTRCPTVNGETTDLTRYPSRRGYEDIVMLCAEGGGELGWTALASPEQGYLWFSLKDPKVLPSTLIWMSNGGRHAPPWNGRNINTIGLEEINAFFHEGLASSVKNNFINALGVETYRRLRREEIFTVNFIQGVVRIHLDFKGVSSIEVADEKKIRIIDHAGQALLVNVETNFLNNGALKDLIEKNFSS